MSGKEKLLVGILIFIVLFAALKLSDEPAKPLTPEQITEQKRQDSLQAEYNRQKENLRTIRYLVKSHIKKNLKDPDSFDEIQHEEFEVTNKTKKLYYQASIKYRAKNSFGGYNVEKWCFNFDKNLQNTKVFECE
ncbi:hypothetical protein [Dyadobacter fermentans]|uniref:Uncharacterized protein n=1 Tax=Dyadobacter fermentans (strain ATCC 700827 / DSM 18053 / CIP 107007 / KCTC 52180 / NS114) TaxID=471854 RepID=C6VVE7_DYAFD|nr:hypothetical protein [Dyadobacter fermentans]ACT96677.1 hypothetical protein Dfer_5486 [Dyadobacter fermentans DSM 18053]